MKVETKPQVSVNLEKAPETVEKFSSWLESKLRRVGSIEPNPKNESKFSIMLFRLDPNFSQFDTQVKAVYKSEDGDRLIFTNNSKLFHPHKNGEGIYLHISCSLNALNVKFESVEIG